MSTAHFYSQVLHTPSRTHGFEPVEVEGALPASLKGTFWRNGPGQFELFERPYVNFLDGDGLATAVRIADGRAEMACRVVACPELATERAAGRALYASGQTRGSWWRMVGGRGKSPRNINILHHGGRTWALAEGGLPIPLDEGLGSAPPEPFVEGQQSFHAHYRVDPRDGTTYGFGLSYGRVCALNIYRLPRGGRPSLMASVPLPGMRVMLHDIGFAGDALIALVHPMGLRMWPLLTGFAPVFDALDWRPAEGSEVIIIPLADPAAVRRYTVPAFYNFHFGNAFRDGDAYQVDISRLPTLDLLSAFSVEEMRRADIPVPDPSRFGRLTLRGETAEWTALAEGETEFPMVDPRRAGQRHRYTWTQNGPHNVGRLGRFDHETGDWVLPPLGAQEYAGEVSLVPYGPGEHEVWVLTHGFDLEAGRSGVLVLDGAQPDAPPVARIWFPHLVPPSVHGTFVEG